MLKLQTRPFTTSASITTTIFTPEAVAAQFTKMIPQMPITNRPFNLHSAGIAALAILCVALMGCSLMKPAPPSPEKIRTALDKVIKKDNPDASYSITSADVHSTGTLISVKISFEDFKFKGGDGKERDFYTGKATATFDLKNGKWIFNTLQTSEPENVLLLPDIPVE